MTGPEDGQEITRLLGEWRSGNRSALDQLSPIVHQELRRIAVAYMRRERADHTLQPTALINEAYVRLLGQGGISFSNRAHFFGIAAQIMRQILVDFARRRVAVKRGSGLREELNEAMQVSVQQSEELLAVHQALDRLAAFDERKARIMEMRHFGGLSREEIAEVTGMSLATVKRDMHLAGAWLKRELTLAPGAGARTGAEA
jgi:RNA polymerase sigma factor (TIGR02999 family)